MTGKPAQPRKKAAKVAPARKRRPRPSRPPKLRLVKVLVQPVFVVDHGTHVTELEHPAVVIPALEWPTYSSERFPREVAEFEKAIARGELPSSAGE